MRYNINEVTTFREVLGWISYDLDNSYSLDKDSKGNFYVNKLYITPESLSYKTEYGELRAGLFEKVEALYNLLQEDKEHEKNSSM